MLNTIDKIEKSCKRMGLRPMVNYRADAVIRRLELVELILRRTLENMMKQ